MAIVTGAGRDAVGVLVVTYACAFYVAHAGAWAPGNALSGENLWHNSGASRRGGRKAVSDEYEHATLSVVIAIPRRQ